MAHITTKLDCHHRLSAFAGLLHGGPNPGWTTFKADFDVAVLEGKQTCPSTEHGVPDSDTGRAAHSLLFHDPWLILCGGAEGVDPPVFVTSNDARLSFPFIFSRWKRPFHTLMVV